MDTTHPLPPGWSIEGAERVYESPWIRVRKERLVRPDGGRQDWYLTEEPDVVMIFCVASDGRIVLNRQFKFGLKQWVLEPCAGLVDPGETPERAAWRELEEETGFVPKRLQLMRECALSPSRSASRAFLYYADGAERTGTLNPEPGEVIELATFSPEELRDRVVSGEGIPALAALCCMLGIERLSVERETKN